jgi:protein O-mannosyl-transferase
VSSSAISVETAAADSEHQASTQGDHRTSPWLLALLLVALTLFAYWPTFSNGFVNYDDNAYVTQNDHLQPGLTVANISWAFRTTIIANWHPVTWISHMADIQFFGLHAAGHHATSLLLHALNVVLLFYLLVSATGFLWRSFLVAALFALHPFNVECVAWVSERKTLLCTLFLFLALFAYGWYARKPGVGRYVVVAALFAIGLAAKPMIITLPFALLLLDYWPLARLPVPNRREDLPFFFAKLWPLVLEKLPLLLFSAGSAYITLLAQGRSNAIAANELFSISVRVANALWSYVLYLLRALWPVDLIVYYPHPENSLALWKPLAAAVFILLFTSLCIRRRHERYLLVGWLWYLGCLVPVIGLVQVGRQAMADRYAYSTLLGIFVLVVWWLADHAASLGLRSRTLGAVAVPFLVFFGAFTWRQTTFWKDSFSLFARTLEIAPVNFIAQNNMGEAYMQIGRPDLAYDYFLRATQQKPRFGLAHYNLGIVLVGKNRAGEARQEFQAAIRYGQDAPETAAAYHNLGIVLLGDNQLADSIHMFSEALRLAPGKQSSYLARGLAEFRLANFHAAEADFVAGANLAPDSVASFWVGRAREAQGNTSGAIEAYRKALKLQPDKQDAKERLDALLSGRVLPFNRSEN